MSFELESDLTFYLTTDGLIDQIGGPKRRGFGRTRFKSLLQSIGGESLDRQRENIIEALEEYQGDEVRRDDICVIGFRITNGSCSDAGR